MATNETTWSGLLQNIVANVEDIVGLEVRLAVTEVKQEARDAAQASMSLAAGIVLGLYAFGFAMLCVMFALHVALSLWLSALIVGVLLAIPAGIMVGGGLKKIQTIHGPEETIASVKENVQWAKHLGK